MSRFHRAAPRPTLLTVALLVLVGILALGPSGGLWRLAAGSLAAGLLVVVWLGSAPRTAVHQARPASRRPASLLSTGLYDPLTRLPNRTLLNELLEKQLAQAERSGYRMGVVVLDLDRFKSVNDGQGQVVGDRILMELARRFQTRIRQSDTLARTGGDGFTLLVAKVDRPEDVALAAGRMLGALDADFEAPDGGVLLTASAGSSVYPDDSTEPTLLLSYAEEALGRAKAQGGNSLQMHGPTMNRRTRERARLEQDLRRAITDRALTVHYQPQVSLADGRLVGLEALVRWQHAELGLLTAGRFIPLAESSGLMRELGAWLLEEICRQIADWRARGLEAVPVSVNASIRQFQGGDVAALVERSLTAAGVDPCLLEIEITESIASHESERISESLTEIQRLGVKIHLDDFGTGYSSLSNLLRYPVDKLKIDRSFVEGVPEAEDSAKIVHLTISLARSLDLELIAEGVETSEQLEFLRAAGCEAAQGYLLGRPAPRETVEKLLGQGGVDLEEMLAQGRESA